MKPRIIGTVVAALAILLLGVGLGSVLVSPDKVVSIIANQVFGTELAEGIDPTQVSIIWSLRLPRAILAFVVGAALSVSGAVMQSVLKNPLASSYTLGVASGASLGASLVLLLGFSLPILTMATLPITGFVFGFGTLLLAIAFATRIDSRLENNTIILTGMVISLFVNAAVTMISAVSRESIQRLIYWQMGSFALKDWSTVFVLLPIALIGTALVMHHNLELDMITFGEEQAQTMGVNIKGVKWILLITSAALTGTAISFVGVIGFVDLVAPHVVRKVFGSSHKYVIPMSAVSGGAFMVLCDLLARTGFNGQELPVGAVSAMIGAPFFAYIYFSQRSKA